LIRFAQLLFVPIKESRVLEAQRKGTLAVKCPE
jgi:hypothetical protein